MPDHLFICNLTFCREVAVRVPSGSAPDAGGHIISRKKGVSCTPGNQFIIDVSRLEKFHRIRFALLKSC